MPDKIANAPLIRERRRKDECIDIFYICNAARRGDAALLLVRGAERIVEHFLGIQSVNFYLATVLSTPVELDSRR